VCNDKVLTEQLVTLVDI